MVIMRCITGDMGILANHEATSAILDFGVLRILNDNSERRMAVFGGITQVRDNTVTIIANDAQWPEEIDIASVKAERDRLEHREQEELDDLELKRDQVQLRKSLLQIEVSEFTGGSKVENVEKSD